MHLVAPSAQHKESFLEALREYQKEDSEIKTDLNFLNIPLLEKDFQSYINMLFNISLGKNLPSGYVPETTYWLVDGDEYIGRIGIRHTLNESLLREGGHVGYNIRPSRRQQGFGTKILSLGLPKIKELGIEKALVTCDENNVGSKKIIVANGGIFENSVEMSQGRPRKLRYWIIL